jgi:hypothetical protein
VTRDQLLQILSQIESNNGANTNHPIITHGPDTGTQAIGRYGLTNATVDDTIKNNPNLKNILGQMDPVSKKQYLESHPDIEKNIAGSLADRLLQRYGGDENKVAYAWNHGSYLDPNRITDETLNKDSYTQKFQRLKNKISNASSSPQEQLIAQQKGQPAPKIVAENGQTINDIINDPLNPFTKEFNNTSENDEDEIDPAQVKARLSYL